MDEFNRNTENNQEQPTTPFQTPVRGVGGARMSSQDTADSIRWNDTEMPSNTGAYASGTDSTSSDTQANTGAYDSNTADSAQQSGSIYGTSDTPSSAQQSDSIYGTSGTPNSGSYGAGGGTVPPSNSAYQQWSNNNRKNPRKPKKARKNFPWKPVVAAVLIAGIAFGGGVAVSGGWSSGSNNSASSAASSSTAGSTQIPADSTTVAISTTSDDLASYSEVYDKASPSVVLVTVSSTAQGTSGSGSGVIMSEDGYIITNNHVVADCDTYSVTLSDSTTYTATLVGTDEQTDLAVLKVDATGLTAAEFGDSESVKVGDRAFAIGSPGGADYQNSFTGGFISALNRNVTINDRVMSLIQTDTAINAGNSGGALINSAGQVIGITSSKLSSSGLTSASIEGMGFAIPTATVKEVVDQLIAYGHVTGRPAIGISGYDIDETRAAYYNLPQGVMISSINTASDANNQDVQPGDIITAANGTDITSMSELNAIKNEMAAGDTLELKLYRSSTGATSTVTIKLIDEADLASTATTSTDSSSSSGSNGSYGYSYGYTNPFGNSYGY